MIASRLAILNRSVRMIRSLAIAHFLVGILCCALVAIVPRTPRILEFLPVVILLAIVLSQACLLGLWAAFSNAGERILALVLAVGALYLEGQLELVVGQEGLQLAAATTALVAAGVLIAIRRRGTHLWTIAEPASHVGREHYQMKIRGLMILTLVLALAFAGARALRDVGPVSVILTIVFSLCNAALGGAAAWAALGLTPPLKRWPAVFLLSAALGSLFWYAVRSPVSDAYWNINLCLLLQASMTFGSLLVVRSCGFRFFPKDLVACGV
jgi:hypothetical protein